jgi:8-oxo-dGTP pyrophosphatase MutT (NUDIX family)
MGVDMSFSSFTSRQKAHILYQLTGHIQECNRSSFRSFFKFYIKNTHVGWIHKKFLPYIREFGQTFHVGPGAVYLSSKLINPKTMTDAINEFIRFLETENVIYQTREELCPIAPTFTMRPMCHIYRHGLPFLGLRSYGVHLNAYTYFNNHCYMWVSKRSASKSAAPGKLDHLVAGGVPSGFSIFENLEKEAYEEAGIDLETIKQAKSVGVLSYRRQVRYKMRRGTIFNFDLELPQSFTPYNTDGEVESFMLLPIEEVFERAGESDSFKFNTILSLTDFFIRHGFITPDDPGYLNLFYKLHRAQVL